MSWDANAVCQVVGLLLHGVEAVDEVVPGELGRERGLRTGRDVPFRVADDVEGGLPDGGTAVILAVTVHGLDQYIAIAIIEGGTAHEAAGGVDVLVVGLHDPLAGVGAEHVSEDGEADEEHDGQRVHPFGSFEDSIHRLNTHLLRTSVRPRSGCPPP